MEDNQRFDLHYLLKHEGAIIRQAAKNSLSMEVRDYFEMLAEFINNRLLISDTLDKIINSAIDETTTQDLSTIKHLLLDIGDNKITNKIYEIIAALNKGNDPQAAAYARSILPDVNNLIERVKVAKKLESLNAQNHEINQALNMNLNGLKLQEVIERLLYNDETRKLTVLAVDDVSAMLLAISSSLNKDYTVYTMTKPTMVEDFLNYYTPELFLLDYQMPDIDGFDLVPIIRRFDEHKETPIIFVTALGTFDHVSAAITLGASDFIIKPINPVVLREKVAKHIVRKKIYK